LVIGLFFSWHNYSFVRYYFFSKNVLPCSRFIKQ
jgi:hypothetical protein